MLRLWVHTVREGRFPVEVPRGDTVRNIKEYLHRQKGFPHLEQRLVFKGNQLKDDCNLEDVGLRNDDSVMLLVPLVKQESALPFEAPFLLGQPATQTHVVPQPQPHLQPTPPLQGDFRMILEMATAALSGAPPSNNINLPFLPVPPPAQFPTAANPAGTSSAPMPVSPSVLPQMEPVLPEPKLEDVQVLQEMGFPVARVKKALLLSKMNLEDAMEWLLMHSEDENADAPLTIEQKHEVARLYGPVVYLDSRVQHAIDANMCTYAVTGPNFATQSWYQCYTCNLLGSEGCCETCARICHRGHQLARQKRISQFYCDCGAGAHTFKCRAMKKPSTTATTATTVTTTTTTARQPSGEQQ